MDEFTIKVDDLSLEKVEVLKSEILTAISKAIGEELQPSVLAAADGVKGKKDEVCWRRGGKDDVCWRR